VKFTDPNKRPVALVVKPESIPADLKALNNWVPWSYSWRWKDIKDKTKGGEWAKPPYQGAKNNDPATWHTFNEAFELYQRLGLDGLYFAHPNDRSITSGDLDDCFNDGKPKLEARAIVDAVNTYTEYSPSNGGLRTFSVGSKPGTECKRPSKHTSEMYDHDRFMSVTGHHYDEAPETLNNDDAAIAAGYSLMFPGDTKLSTIVERVEPQMDDEDVIQRARNAENGNLFIQLFYGGDVDSYPSESEAVYALWGFLRFWCRADADQMMQIFRDSALYRLNPKKRERLMEDEVEKIIAAGGDVYQGSGDVGNQPTVVIEPDGTRLEIKIRGCDDDSNVQRFYDRYGKTLRYVAETGKFLEHNGKHWKEVSTTTIKQRARGVATIVRHEAAKAGELTGRESKGQREKKERIANELTKWARQSSMKERIKAIVELIKGDVEVSISTFDRNPLIFNCENGVYDIPTGTFILGHNPADYCSHNAGPYIKGAKNAKWEAFKKKVQPSAEVRAFLKRAAGYSATALVNEEALFYLYGDGQAGKSTYVEAVRSAMGSYGKAESFSTFLIKGDGSQVRPRPELLRLVGSRFVRCIETNKNVRWDSALLNTLVSGEPYAARDLFSSDLIEVAATFKLWCVSNHRVRADYDPEEEGGFWRRLYPIPFEVVIPEDEKDMGLKSYFMNDPDAKAAILAEILEGATEWYKLSDGGRINGLQAPKEIIAARYDYKAAQSPIYEFLKNECRIGAEYRVPITDLWDVFSDQRKGYEIKKVRSASSLGRYLKGLGFEKDKVGNVRYWFGLRLLGDDEEPDDAFSLSTLVHLKGQNKKSLDVNTSRKEESQKETSKCTSVQDLDQAGLALIIRDTLLSWRYARSDPIAKVDRKNLLNVIAAQIHRQYPEWNGRIIQDDINHLAESDSEIQTILAELTE
jgi:putative DNA primase/helicase